MTIAAVYHLGFTRYREDGVRAPEIGNTIISMPMLLSTNPIGSIADHAATHISAAAGALAWTMLDWLRTGKPTLLGASSGLVARPR